MFNVGDKVLAKEDGFPDVIGPIVSIDFDRDWPIRVRTEKADIGFKPEQLTAVSAQQAVGADPTSPVCKAVTAAAAQPHQVRRLSLQPSFFDISNKNDVIYTPEWVARDLVEWFNPTGRVLEPCKGSGAILQFLPGASWCEITEGEDFYAWTEPVDWIISNPPYSDFKNWLEHSYQISKNIVYLVPLNKFFNAYGQMEACKKNGWVRHIRVYGTGTRLNFPMGNAIGAMHFVREYWGDTSWSWYQSRRLTSGSS